MFTIRDKAIAQLWRQLAIHRERFDVWRETKIIIDNRHYGRKNRQKEKRAASSLYYVLK
jgi:hypothetical protein